MKKLVLFCSVLLLSVGTFIACNSDDPYTETEISYVGWLDSLTWTDANDTVFTGLVTEALESSKVKLSGAESLLNEKSRIDYTSETMGILTCDSMAISDYTKAMDAVNLESLKSVIFANHSDSLVKAGYANADALPIDEFTAHLSLYSGRVRNAIRTYKKIFK